MVKLYFPEPDVSPFSSSVVLSSSLSSFQGVVRIHIFEARNLEDRDMTLLKGKSDPYARVSGKLLFCSLENRSDLYSLSVGGQSHKTRTIDNSLNPVWDEYFEAVVDQASGQRINIELFDEDVASADEFLGRMSIDISVVRSKGVVDEVRYRAHFWVTMTLSGSTSSFLFSVVCIGRRQKRRFAFTYLLAGPELRSCNCRGGVPFSRDNATTSCRSAPEIEGFEKQTYAGHFEQRCIDGLCGWCY